MKAATRITSKGQVVIPKRIRDRLRWRPGTRLEVDELHDGGVRLAPPRAPADEFERLLASVVGCLTDGDAIAALETEHRTEVARDARRRRP
ncbi:MAG: AbrB/MazE/SpoVT family DNA-binding domain-containing protein [Deltaproteobacteria bacterium]|nr:AbrB/MazE/SpoVT family DNA-binding domain-containing protein [Deltaproteobacteria bacterium]